jgi:hypothetical protein
MVNFHWIRCIYLKVSYDKVNKDVRLHSTNVNYQKDVKYAKEAVTALIMQQKYSDNTINQS